jgi:hypothetical protein
LESDGGEDASTRTVEGRRVLLLGVLFSALLVTVVRLAYGFSNPLDGSWNTQYQTPSSRSA